MPSVPKYNNRPLQETGVSIDRVNPGAATGATDIAGFRRINNQAEKLGAGVFEAQKKAQSGADDLLVTEAIDKFKRRETDMLFNRKEGAFARQGKDSLGVADEYGEKYNTLSGEIENTLQNDRQKEAFRLWSTKRRSEFDRSLEKHTFSEMEKHDTETTESAIKSAMDDAISNYQSTNKIKESLGEQKAYIESHAERTGKSKEWVETRVKDATSKTHVEVINRMLSMGDDLQASDYFKVNKKELSGMDMARMEKALEEGSLRGFAQRKTDEIMSSNATMSEALDKARQIQDPKKRDETVRRVKQRFSDKESAFELERKNMFENAFNMVDQAGKRDVIPPETWAALSPTQKRAIDAWLKHKADGMSIQTNWKSYYELEQLAGNPSTRRMFLRTDLLEYRHELGDSEFKKLSALQSSLRRGEDKDRKELDGLETKNSIINGALDRMGVKQGSKANKDHAENEARFRKAVDDRVIQLQERTGKKVNNDELREIVDDLSIEVITDHGFLWGLGPNSTKRLFQLNPGDSATVDFDEIPAFEVAKIRQALERTGVKSPSEDQIAELYSKKVSRALGTIKDAN